MSRRVHRLGRDVALVTLVLGTLTFSPDALAEEAPLSSRVKINVGIGTWISVGDTQWSHNASSQSPLGNPTSKLTYTDHSTNTIELTAKVSVGPRWFGRLNVGGAKIGGGRLTDDDFLSPVCRLMEKIPPQAPIAT